MREQANPHANAAQSDVQLIHADGQGRCILVCEHATNFIPQEFAELGLKEAERQSHIAWDIGAFEVAKLLSQSLDAPLVAPAVSRLVYDCNRPAEAKSSVPETSEIYHIPGNAGLTDEERFGRYHRYCQPYRKALSSVVEHALTEGRHPALVTVHSFTPVFNGERRDVEIGILYDEDTRLADELLKSATRSTNLNVMRNSPYGPEDGVTFTLVYHALPHGLLNVMIEIRNDLITDTAGQQAIAQKLALCLNDALTALDGAPDLEQVS